MPTHHRKQRISYLFLCATRFLVCIFAAVRAWRVPGMYQAIGGVLFAAIFVAAWTLRARTIRANAAGPATARPGRDAPCNTICARRVSLGWGSVHRGRQRR